MRLDELSFAPREKEHHFDCAYVTLPNNYTIYVEKRLWDRSNHNPWGVYLYPPKADGSPDTDYKSYNWVSHRINLDDLLATCILNAYIENPTAFIGEKSDNSS